MAAAVSLARSVPDGMHCAYLDMRKAYENVAQRMREKLTGPLNEQACPVLTMSKGKTQLFCGCSAKIRRNLAKGNEGCTRRLGDVRTGRRQEYPLHGLYSGRA